MRAGVSTARWAVSPPSQAFYQSEFTTLPECWANTSHFWAHAMNAWKSFQFDIACSQWSATPAGPS